MFESIKQTIEDGRIVKYKITKNKKALNFKEVIALLEKSSSFRRYLTALLKDHPAEGYFWEVKKITKDKLEEDFEFVLVDSSTLPGIKADKASFEQYFRKEDLVVTFPNLKGDAKLIVPTIQSEEKHYAHLANFIRNAPFQQIDKFWQVVGKEYKNAISDQPKWLSTAGLGVYWLHVRIDSTPKYYRYKAYKN